MTERGRNEFNIDRLVRLKQINEICKDVKTMFRDWDDFVSESISLTITWWKDPQSAIDTAYEWFPHYTAEMKAEMKEQMKKGGEYEKFLELMEAHNKKNGISLEPREVNFEDREGSHYRIDPLRMAMIQDIVDEVDMYSSTEDFFDKSLDLMITWWSHPNAAVQIFLDMWPFMTDKQRELFEKLHPQTYYKFEKMAHAQQELKKEQVSIRFKNSEDGLRDGLEIVQQPLQQQKISEVGFVELHRAIGQDHKILLTDDMEKIARDADEAVISLCTQLDETDVIINDLSIEREITELPDAKMDQDGNIHGKLPYDEFPIIWAFYSRFFPVKVVVSVLADMIAEKGVGMVEYDQFRERAYNVALGLSQEIKQYENKWKRKRNVKISAGLPQPPVDERAYISPKMRLDKINKFNSSKERFQNHFIGMSEEMWNKKQNAKPDKKKKREEKPTKNKNDIAYFSGALNAMGLASFEVEKEKGSSQYKIKIGLTPKGAKFYRKKNPVLVNYMDKRGQADKALEVTESTFIRKNIIPSFSLEEMFVSKIEEKLNEKTLNAKEIDKEFLTVSTDWLQKEEKKDVKNTWYSTMNMVRSDESLVTPWRVATMGRLSEMGIVDWVIVRETGVSEFSLSKPVEKAPKITTR